MAHIIFGLTLTQGQALPFTGHLLRESERYISEGVSCPVLYPIPTKHFFPLHDLAKV